MEQMKSLCLGLYLVDQLARVINHFTLILFPLDSFFFWCFFKIIHSVIYFLSHFDVEDCLQLA